MADPEEEPLKLTPEQQKALNEAQDKPVIYDTLQDGSRRPGTDFTGNLTDFQFTFEWQWESADKKFLIEKSTQEKFNGWLHIQDKRLDENVYPGQEQKIKFDNGFYNFSESLSDDEGAD